jgi:type II secretory pathway component PulL
MATSEVSVKLRLRHAKARRFRMWMGIEIMKLGARIAQGPAVDIEVGTEHRQKQTWLGHLKFWSPMILLMLAFLFCCWVVHMGPGGADRFFGFKE